MANQPMPTSRRELLRGAAALGGLAVAGPSWVAGTVTLGIDGGLDQRQLAIAFPQKGSAPGRRSRS